MASLDQAPHCLLELERICEHDVVGAVQIDQHFDPRAVRFALFDLQNEPHVPVRIGGGELQAYRVPALRLQRRPIVPRAALASPIP